MNIEDAKKYIHTKWDDSITPNLEKYISIPNKSPMFDSNWAQNGYMDEAVTLIKDWCLDNAPTGMKLDVIQSDSRTPLIYIEIPATGDDGTILLYGHLDKQPEMEGWDEDLSPWKPVIKDGKLYGRGGADDGYSVFCAITAINALQQQNISHPRCVIIIEASEESGSNDLPYYMEELKLRIGTPNLVICLDSSCGNYEQLWVTTSLRGIVGGKLRVQISSEGVHSGSASGVIPSSFRIMRKLLARVEDVDTGEIIVPILSVDIPKERVLEADKTAKTLQNTVYTEFPFLDSSKPVTTDVSQLILNKTWKAALEVTGVSGIPVMSEAGNVLRPFTELKLSFRIPPTMDANVAALELKKVLESDPPYGARITFEVEDIATGWNAPKSEAHLLHTVNEASKLYFDQDAQCIGEGGSIPFMGMLGEAFPKAQFVITGVLGPKANAHGPNEFLHLAYAKQLTGAIAHIIGNNSKSSA